MTRLIARLVLAMLILPIAGAVFVLLMGAVVVPSARAGGPPAASAVVIMWLLFYVFVGAYWLLLWRSSVRWTTRRRALTMLAAPAAICAGVAVGAVIHGVFAPGGAPAFVAALIGGGVPPIAWVLATVLIWRETNEERVARIKATGADALVCPMCGYSLAGLNEATCPECGSRFTLERLVASQPERDTALQDV